MAARVSEKGYEWVSEKVYKKEDVGESYERVWMKVYDSEGVRERLRVGVGKSL